MQKKTRSLLEELESLYIERDHRHVLENRANNAIANAIRVVEMLESQYDKEISDILTRKLLNAIKLKEASKFTRTLRKIDANTRSNTNKKPSD